MFSVDKPLGWFNSHSTTIIKDSWIVFKEIQILCMGKDEFHHKLAPNMITTVTDLTKPKT